MGSAYKVAKYNTVKNGVGFVTLLKYAVIVENGEKYLVPLFFNNTDQKLDSLTVSVEEYDANNKAINKIEATLGELSASPKTSFGSDKKIKLSPACSDVNVFVRKGVYGKYERANEPSGEVLSYKADTTYTDKQICELTDGKKYTKKHLCKSDFPATCIISILALFVLAFSFFSYLNYFKATQTTFLRDGCLYSFVDRENKKTVELIGFEGHNRSAVIPDYIEDYKVVKICTGAFSGQSILEKVTIEGSPEIEKGAFANFYSLTDIDLGKNTRIERQSFYGCTSLRTVVAPYVTVIDNMAFGSCRLLESVEISSETDRVIINDKAFFGCSSLRLFSCGADITADGGVTLLSDCVSLEKLSLKSLPDGIKTVTELTGRTYSLIELSIENLGVIGDNFCIDSFNLSKVTIGKLDDGNIGDNAFFGCSSLTEFNVNTTITSVGNRAFQNTKIASFEGASLERIGEYAFAENTELRSFSIGENITKIPEGLFDACAGLKEVNIQSDYKEIGANAFKDCSSLTSIYISENLKTIGDNAFSGCRALEKIELPASVTLIGDGAFLNCKKIKTLTIPYSVEAIGENLFYGCDSLAELTVPFVGRTSDDQSGIYYFFSSVGAERTAIPKKLKRITVTRGNAYDGIFAGAVNIEEVIFESLFDSIGENAFNGCSSLKKIVFPDKLRSIKPYAFYGCSSLVSMVIPDTVTEIGSGIFASCASLSELTVPFLGSTMYSAQPLSYFYDYYNDPYALTKIVIKGGLQIADGAFQDCMNLENVVLPDRLTRIGNDAFYNCNYLQSIDLPDTLTNIGDRAFAWCTSLRSIMLPIGLKNIGDGAFGMCFHLYKVYNNSSINITAGSDTAYSGSIGENAIYVAKNGEAIPEGKYYDFEFIKSKDGTVYATGYEGNDNILNFPSVAILNDGVKYEKFKIAKYAFSYSAPARKITEISLSDGVTEIGNNAFDGCTELKAITFGKNVEVIGNSAFAGCYLLNSADLSSSLRSIGADAFGGCSSLNAVRLPESLETIDASAFRSCGLREVVVPADVTRIANQTFEACQSLVKVVLSDKTTSIGESAFNECSSLTEINFPAELKAVENNAFYNCSSLLNVNIPGTLDEIGGSAFFGCSSLQRVSLNGNNIALPESVFAYCGALETVNLSGITEIGYEAFKACSNLEEIYIPQGVKTIESCAFEYCSSLETVFIPSTVNTLSDTAFQTCGRIYEIYNLSGLQITASNSNYGDLTANVYKIHTNANEARMDKAKTENITFIKPEREWLLVRYDDPENYLRLENYSIAGYSINSYRITDGLFAGGSYQKLYIGEEVTSIGKSTFTSSQLTQVEFAKSSKVTEIPEYAFDGCGGLSKVVFADSVKTIGQYAFSTCMLDKTEKLPSSLKTIGTYAFAYCNLKSLYIPKYLETVGNEAFVGCAELIEIYNLSSLKITAGSTSYGGVARYALVVNKSEDAPRVIDSAVNGYRFLKISGVWYLHSVNNFDSALFVLPHNVTIGGEKVEKYKIMSNAFSGFNGFSFVIPKEVSAIARDSFSTTIETIYYEGTEQELNKLLPSGCNVGEKYYYAKCVHESGQWSYSSSNSITTVVNQFKMIKKTAATCTKDGETVYQCPACKEQKIEINGKATGHNYDSNGVCKTCGEKKSSSGKKNARLKVDVKCDKRKLVVSCDRKSDKGIG